ncbi:hypothetical protein M9Y10_007550 [Tritrichomonas musculus]|uniref:Myb-like DNA-binding domain containing protein n=1 Tax=Tritrichomonas musculus TaxID=1915356 RepID=A0ABR2J3E8_9EUKA
MFTKSPPSMNQNIVSPSNQNLSQQTKRRTRIPFTKEEDEQLLQLVQYFGVNDKNNWYFIASHINGRSPRQCRERYQLFLSDNIRKKAKWTKEEDELLISKYKVYGPHWKQLEKFFVGRTSYNIKNRFISLNRRINITCQNEESGNKNIDVYESPTIKKEITQNTNLSFNTDYSSVINESDFDFDLDFFPLLDGNEQYTMFD